MLMKLYYLYQKSPKRLHELKRMVDAWEQSVPKPSKSYGTRWIDHKLRSMQIILDNFGVYMGHIKSLSQTDSQASKRAELKGYYQRWTNASVPIHMAIYLNVLSPLWRLSLVFQQDEHDPVKVVRRIEEFTLTMAKLKLLIDMSLDSPNNIMTNLNKLLDDVREDQGYHFYQGIKLAQFEIAKESTRVLYTETISNITTAMEGRFNDISTSPLFKNIICLLDISTWPMNDIAGFGIDHVNDIAGHFSEVLIHSKCNVQELQNEWTVVKTYVKPMYQNNTNEKYVKLWERIFINEEVLKECKNILHIFELLLITPLITQNWNGCSPACSE